MKKVLLSAFVVMVSITTLFSQNIMDSLIVYYPFNGNANDWGGNGFDETVSGATLTTDKDGNPNNAYYFDGVNDYIDLPLNSALNPDFPFTFSAWIKTYDYSSTGFRIFGSNWREDHYYSGFMVLVSDLGELAMWVGNDEYIGSSSRRGKKSTTILNDSVWYHIVCIFNAMDDFTMYINCEEDLNNTYLGTANSYVSNSSYHPSLGRFDIGDLNEAYGWGVIDEVAIWNRALSPSEIGILCTSTLEVISGTKENTLKILNIFPNPTSDYTTVNFSNPSNDHHQIIISTIDGQLIQKYTDITGSKFSIDCNGFAKGMYFLNILNMATGENAIKKFIVN